MCGVGGKTIHEARQNISINEMNFWMDYRNRFGSLNVGRRVEQAVGKLSFLFAMVNSSKNNQPKIEDFMPHESFKQEQTESDDSSLEQQLLSMIPNL